MRHIVHRDQLIEFRQYLLVAERSLATISKYLHDVTQFIKYVGEGNEVTKETTIEYKKWLSEHYETSSANSMIAALNSYLQVMGWSECRVRAFKLQRQMYRNDDRYLTKEEYIRLLNVARKRGQDWLYVIMQTICATGIRVSELPYFTMEALETRRVRVSLKGKKRVVVLPIELCIELNRYASSHHISSGSIFVTKNGRIIDRSNILHGMKALCDEAEVERSKVFPHNLRHLFAVTYYNRDHDISHLADILGHSSINTTRVYTLVSVEEHERLIGDLGLVMK